MIAGSGRCHEHPDRPGLGICVECRQVICLECTTQFEGINRCARCLGQKLLTAQKLVDRREWTLGNVLLSLLSVATLFLAVYGLAVLVS